MGSRKEPRNGNGESRSEARKRDSFELSMRDLRARFLLGKNSLFVSGSLSSPSFYVRELAVRVVAREKRGLRTGRGIIAACLPRMFIPTNGESRVLLTLEQDFSSVASQPAPSGINRPI